MPGRSGRDEKQFGAPLGVQTPVNATDRPKVGPADPDIQRKAIAKQDADAAKEAHAGLYQPKPTPATPSPSRDLSVLGAAEKIAGRGQQIDQAVDDAT